METNDHDQLLTIPEAARMCRIDKRSMYRLALAGAVDTVHPTRRRTLVWRSDVIDYLERQTRRRQMSSEERFWIDMEAMRNVSRSR